MRAAWLETDVVDGTRARCEGIETEGAGTTIEGGLRSRSRWEFAGEAGRGTFRFREVDTGDELLVFSLVFPFIAREA